MLCRIGSKVKLATKSNARFSVLVATEEFPFQDSLKPQPVKQTVLSTSVADSGIKMITRDCQSPFVNLRFAVSGGSRAENPFQKGAAHLLATAAYSGNKTNSGLRFVQAFEALGATFTSTAGKEFISYDVSVLPDNVEPVVALVASAIASPPYAAYVLEECKGFAQIAYDNFAVDYTAQVHQLIHECAFGESSPLGASIYAPKLSKLTTDYVVDYRNTRFIAPHVTICGNGISEADLKGLVNKYGSLIPAGTAEPLPDSPYVGGDVKMRVDLNGVTHLALAFPTPSGADAKTYKVLNELLSARLSGLKVCLESFYEGYSTGGILGIHAAGAEPSIASMNLEAAIKVLKEIATNTPTDVEAAKSKAALKNFLLLEGEGSTDVLLKASLENTTVENYVDLRDVTAEAVKAAAATMLNSSSVPSYAVLGTTAGTPSFAAVKSLLM